MPRFPLRLRGPPTPRNWAEFLGILASPIQTSDPQNTRAILAISMGKELSGMLLTNSQSTLLAKLEHQGLVNSQFWRFQFQLERASGILNEHPTSLTV
jgi:hypothetical protein